MISEKEYETQCGKKVTVLGRTNGIGYECLECSDGIFRYDRSTSSEDAGRCTATNFDYSYPHNFKRKDRPHLVRNMTNISTWQESVSSLNAPLTDLQTKAAMQAEIDNLRAAMHAVLDDSMLIDFLENATAFSRTGVSFDYDKDKGYRIMWRGYLGRRYKSIREAIANSKFRK